jgi:hypothetical protein
MSAVISLMHADPRHNWTIWGLGTIAERRPKKEDQTKMTSDEILSITALNSRKLVTSRFDKTLGDLTDERLQQQIAPGKNRVFYLFGRKAIEMTVS